MQHSPDISNCSTSLEKVKRDDFRYTVCSILLNHVFFHGRSTLYAKINVKIRHAYSFRIQKPLKEQMICHRVNFCNAHAVRTEAACPRTSSRANRNPVLFGIADISPDNQKIIHIAHLLNHLRFSLQAISHRFWNRRSIAFLHAFFTECLKKCDVVRNTLHRKGWQMQCSCFQFHMTAVCNSFRVGNRLRHRCK